jgi:hypothetical protein
MASAGSDNENASPYRKGILRHCLPHRSVDGPNADHRAEQTTKVEVMFVRPEQIAEIGKRHELRRMRLVVTREGETYNDAQGGMQFPVRRPAGTSGSLAARRHQARRLV